MKLCLPLKCRSSSDREDRFSHQILELGIDAQPTAEHGGVDVAEVDLEGWVAEVQIFQVRGRAEVARRTHRTYWRLSGDPDTRKLAQPPRASSKRSPYLSSHPRQAQRRSPRE